MAGISISHAYLDESGGLDQGHFVIGGYVAPVESWKDFTDDWLAVLEEDPELPPFHAVDFEAEQNGFEVLTGNPDLKRRKLAGLVNVIKKHRPHGVLLVVGMDDFRRRVPKPSTERLKRRKQAWRYPYTYGAAHLVGSLCDYHEEIGHDLGTIECIFDWMEQFRKPMKKIVQDAVIAAIEEESPKHAKRLATPRWPKPSERANHIPLQAADLLVWHQRRAKDHRDGRNRRAWRELKALKPRYCTEKDGDSLGRWIYGHSGGTIIPSPPG